MAAEGMDGDKETGMRKPKTPAKSLTDDFVDALGQRWPHTIMNWDTSNNGKFVPWGCVKQAFACLDRFDIEGARACLMRPVTSGLLGGPDITGIIGHAPGAAVSAGTHVGWEIKAGTDYQKPGQEVTQRNVERHGGIYILVESVGQGMADLAKYAGPGE